MSGLAASWIMAAMAVMIGLFGSMIADLGIDSDKKRIRQRVFISIAAICTFLVMPLMFRLFIAAVLT